VPRSSHSSALDSHIVWQGPSNQHRFRILRDDSAESFVPPAVESREPRRDDFSVLLSAGPHRLVAGEGNRGATDRPEDERDLGSSRRMQIPFSHRDDDGAIVRGVFDCMVDRGSNAIEVLVPADDAAHDRRVHNTARVAERLFAGSSVHVRVVNGTGS
jgi:hypothetical protein